MAKGKIILIVLVLILVLMGVWSMVHCAPFSKCIWDKSSSGQHKVKKVALTFVGAWDEDDYWKTIIEKFREDELKNRGLDVTVTYEQLDKYNYEDILLDRMVNKKSPNIFMLFNTWLPKYKQRVVPMPDGMMTLDEFDKYFPQVAQDDLISDKKIYSLPMYIDTLALFYNKNMFANAGIIQPPETWNEFADDVEKLTIIGSDGKVQRLGAAIGGADSVNRSQDILMLMVMQNNQKAKRNFSGNLTSFMTTEAQGAIKFYTQFADPKSKYYTWDYNDKTYSVDLFTQLRSAMEINYSYEIANIQSKTGGNLSYGITPIPQQYPDDKINYANYWSPVVAKDADCIKDKGVTASCSDLAWDFISYAAQADNAKSYIDASGRPAANMLLAQKQSEEDGSKLSPFASQILTAHSWSDISNVKNDTILSDMIDSIVTTDRKSKKDVDTAAKTAANLIKELN